MEIVVTPKNAYLINAGSVITLVVDSKLSSASKNSDLLNLKEKKSSININQAVLMSTNPRYKEKIILAHLKLYSSYNKPTAKIDLRYLM